jgi:AcrR family transcriptional regulator
MVAQIASSHGKASRTEWLEAALDTLRNDGIDQVRVLTLAQRLGVNRSSFYWYFKSRENLLDQLIGAWSVRNTASIVERARRPAATITAAVLGIFECWTDERFFDPKLDFAVRAWATRDVAIEAAVVSADQTRLDAIDAMYARYGFDDSLVRARVLYYTQVGYYALGVDEPISVRLGYTPAYLRALTGHRGEQQ